MSTPRRGTFIAVVILTLTLMVTACSSSTPSTTALPPGVVDDALVRFDEPVTLRVLAHDSFAVSTEVLEEFERETNVRVEIVQAGDAVAMTNAAILTAGNPVADVIFGIDENLLGAVGEARLVTPYARCASTSIATRSPARVDRCPPPSRTSPTATTPVSWWCRTRRPRRPVWPSCWPPSPVSAVGTTRQVTQRGCATGRR
jgi:ABC-type thiamine transport system substrate-binding protein